MAVTNPLIAKLKTAQMSGVPLTLAESQTVLRCLDVLFRVADHQCTNPAQEARDVLIQVTE